MNHSPALPRPLRRRAAPLGPLAAAALALAACAAGPGAGELRTRRLALTDAAGSERAVLRTDDRGLPVLELLDAADRRRAQLLVGEADVALRFLDTSGRIRLGLAIDDAGQSHIMLYDADRPRMHLSVNADGRANLICSGDDGAIAAGLGVLADGAAWSVPVPREGGKSPASNK